MELHQTRFLNSDLNFDQICALFYLENVAFKVCMATTTHSKLSKDVQQMSKEEQHMPKEEQQMSKDEQQTSKDEQQMPKEEQQMSKEEQTSKEE